MKKVIPIVIGTILLFSSATYALTSNFNFDSSSLSFGKDSKKQDVASNFNSNYQLTKSLANESEENDEIKSLTKKTTILLLGNPGEENESEESYYQRHKEYLEMGLYNVFPRDENSISGYDESKPYYAYAIASSFALPQIFNQVNEIGVTYKSFGNIKITTKDDLAISTITIPEITAKEENEENPMEYDIVDTNLILTYYFVKIDGEYKLAYLYGETKEEIEDYLNEVDKLENAHGLSIAPSYDNNLREIYNYDKLDSLTDDQIEKVANQNQSNVLILDAYYNTSVISSANGFFIADGIVATTWSFLEEALVNAQFITVSDTQEAYEIDGIVTVNPDTDIAIIKLKEKNGNSITLKNSDEMAIEDPVIALTSKTGIGLTAQKGIITSTDNYIQTSIPLTKQDQGSILIDANSGNVIGMNTNKLGVSSTSYAVDSNILKEVKEKFESTNFEEIETVTFEELKEGYYYTKYNDEIISNNIPDKQWKKYSQIGKIEENIKLNLVKASYKDGIVSLRYENKGTNIITSMQYSSKYQKELQNEGYTATLKTDEKCVYENSDYQVIIMEEFDYLIIVMVRK